VRRRDAACITALYTGRGHAWLAARARSTQSGRSERKATFQSIARKKRIDRNDTDSPNQQEWGTKIRAYKREGHARLAEAIADTIIATPWSNKKEAMDATSAMTTTSENINQTDTVPTKNTPREPGSNPNQLNRHWKDPIRRRNL
jgi:hypothetical protein